MLFAMLLCVALVPFGFASINTTCLPPEEVIALREIGRKLIKDWDFNEDPCCGWGSNSNNIHDNTVTCHYDETSNGTLCHVVSVSLKGQSLQGILPPEFANLPYLQWIDLTYNYLNGTIPPEWGSMKQLQTISIIGNRLSGSIPKELGKITTLKILILEDNRLSGRIPRELGNLASMETLCLSSNNFTGELPASLASLTNMTDLRLSSNNLSGKIPDFIGTWTNLVRFFIQGSGLEGPIPRSITLLKNLLDLRITDLRGPDSFCPPFSNTTSLNYLILRSSNLIGKLPESLGLNLRIIDFSFNKLNGSIPTTYENLLAGEIYLTGNLLSGSVPVWMLSSGKSIDLSFNNFTYESSKISSCQMQKTNLFASFSKDNTSKEVSCLGNNYCPTNWSSLYINCGGRGLAVGNKVYEGDLDPGSSSRFFSTNSHWGFSNTGIFMNAENSNAYVVANTSRLPVNNSELYMSARASALSLTYYGFCMLSGSYQVSLHFADISSAAERTYTSLGRRVFNIYIQGMLMEKDFDISERAGGVGKPIVVSYFVNVVTTLEIRLYWAGKGTTFLPRQGVYGPLISAISVDPLLPVPHKGVSKITVIGIVAGALCLIILLVGVLWWRCYLQRKNTMELGLKGLNTSSFTLRQIKAATNNFDVANKIGEGGFGCVFKGVLPNGTLIAVKQLSSKSKQGNREFLNEIGMISAVQHPHLVKLYGCCVEGNQLLLAYEYLENNSLARALFGPKKWELELKWPIRYRICIHIAKGLAFLHEESRLKIVHRDIKATNVLLDKNLNAKISDFGLAKLDEEDNTHISTRIAGTYGYMAPEYALRGYLTDKADVYSYGIVLLEIVSGMANTVDRAKENHFILLDRAINLKTTGNLMELVDPRLGSEYDIQEMMVVINLALVCTMVSPAVRPTMSSVVAMLEGRTVPAGFVVERSISFTELDHSNTMERLGSTSESQIEEMSIPCADFSTSAVDMYATTDCFSENMIKRQNDAQKLLS
uniref:probable leucine-rich repeat receptor-like serine/threonine-protein kinase At3g14840 n=1 Tax=Erigeron canadensis TaxID=72917 RepID=UPI001CB9B679|nr:probable leucine-rich repeat receptor-like serine/threonine-protein kinase At3g14840 [Erigeron canadensis]